MSDTKPGVRKTGRPSLYRVEYDEQSTKLCELGATDREVAEFLGVSEVTLNAWKHQYPNFLKSLKLGKETADRRVEQSLYRRATGYSYDAVKIFMPAGAKKPVYAAYVEHVPPDPTAMIFWLKNRKPAEWRQVIEVNANVRRSFADYADDELAALAGTHGSAESGGGTGETEGGPNGSDSVH